MPLLLNGKTPAETVAEHLRIFAADMLLPIKEWQHVRHAHRVEDSASADFFDAYLDILNSPEAGRYIDLAQQRGAMLGGEIGIALAEFAR